MYAPLVRIAIVSAEIRPPHVNNEIEKNLGKKELIWISIEKCNFPRVLEGNINLNWNEVWNHSNDM